jgi:hypothetical protein
MESPLWETNKQYMISLSQEASHTLDSRRWEIPRRESIRYCLKITILYYHHHQLANIPFELLMKDLPAPFFSGCVQRNIDLCYELFIGILTDHAIHAESRFAEHEAIRVER